MTDWLLRASDGSNFFSSLPRKIWGINSTISNHKYFIKNVKENDRLWVIKAKSKGKILAVVNYKTHKKRELGPLLNLSKTNQELGWEEDKFWDIEVIYDNIYLLDDVEGLETEIKNPAGIIKYNEKCKLNLPEEYNYIVRYRKKF